MLLCTSLTAGAQGNFSPSAKLLKNKYEQEAAQSRRTAEAKAQVPTARFVITCKMSASPVVVGKQIEALGGTVNSVFGRNLVVTIPTDQIDAMAATEGVLLVDVSTKVKSKTDITRNKTQVDEVLTGNGQSLPQAYTGKGVLIGLIDGGFDFTHPAFKDKDGNLRIKSVYLAGNSEVPSEKVTVTKADQQGNTIDMNLLPGIVTDPKVILDTLQVKDNIESHGTHCASIAAGSHIEGICGTTGTVLGGMAPDAELILCTEQVDDESEAELEDVDDRSTLINSHQLAYMKHYAQQHDMPLVVSWSQNSHMGWHNGTSTAAQLVGDFCKEGNVMMVCASNEGGDKIYIHRTVKPDDPLNVAIDGNRYGAVYYLKTTKPVKVKMGIISFEEEKEVYTFEHVINTGIEENDSIEFAAGTPEQIQQLAHFSDDEMAQLEKIIQDLEKYINQGVGYVTASKGQTLVSPTSDETFAYTEVKLENVSQFVEDEWGFSLYGLTLQIIPEEDAELFSWVDGGSYFVSNKDDYSYTPYETGTSEVSMGDLGTSGEAVTVGAWIGNMTTINEEGGFEEDFNFYGQHLGDYAPFSSWGTDLAGHQCPDTSAPGTDVYASLNSFFDDEMDGYPVAKTKPFTGQFEGQELERDYQWGVSSGTSMSTPAAAGIVALWMQAANDKGKRLTCTDIKDIIAHSADTDQFTQATPIRFGLGKINAYKGLLYVLDLTTAIDGLSQHQPAGVTFRISNGQLIAEGAEDGTEVSLYNLQGVCVGQTTVQNAAVSLAGLPKGVYAVQLGKLGSTLIRL